MIPPAEIPLHFCYRPLDCLHESLRSGRPITRSITKRQRREMVGGGAAAPTGVCRKVPFQSDLCRPMPAVDA
jgi:hypothetical protein